MAANTENSVSGDDIYQGLSLLLAAIMGVIFYYGGQLRCASLLLLPIFLIVRYRITLRLSYLLFVLISLYPIFIGLIQVAYLRDGRQGIDFGIFSQLIYQVAKNNSFTTSLIGTDWNNFFTHHLSPYLFIFGLISKIGVPAENLLIGAHVISITVLVVGIFRLFF
ncbi:MAG: hypothetical protein GYA55_10945 [SAR324 cluster bacterium]|uniref:Uncharacterized protein n=1 Tax=SAR324 cluster bacterium TaxID=2024889 RepID=A0A7X9FT29_9DELT|nr:hypothetical protein [SAR324 cluster bacterium]